MIKKCGLYLGFIALFFCSSPSGYAAMSKYYGGDFYFANTGMEISYYLDNGRAIIREVNWDTMPADAYPCEGYWKNFFSKSSRFISCTLVRHIRGAREEKVFSTAKGLTQAEFYAFLTKTGDVGPQTTLQRGDTYYALHIQVYTPGHTWSNSYIPRAKAEIIPPDEPPPPPLTCSVNGGNLNYGTVSSDKLDNLEAELKISAGCSGPANFTLKAAKGYDNSRGIALNDLGTLRALLSIDGYPAGYGENYNTNGYKTITIKSRLSKQSNTVASGKYSGSVVLVMETE